MMNVMLMGSGDGDTARLDAASYQGLTLSPATASSILHFDSNGGVYHVENGVSLLQYTWKTGPNTAASYSVRYTGISGTAFTTSAAASGAWVDLSGDREWGYTATAGADYSGGATFEIKANGSGVTLDSAFISLWAASQI